MANQPLGQMIIELGLDSTTFASGMKGVNQQLKTSMTEMKSHLSILGKSGDEVDTLKVKQASLSEIVDAQNKKVQIAKETYEACKKEVEGNSEATQKQKDALVKAQNEYVKAVGGLGAYQNQLIEVNARLLALESPIYKVGSALETMGEKITNAGNKVTDIGKKMTLGVTTPLLGLGIAATKSAMEWESAFAGVKKTVDEVVDANGNIVYSYKEIEDSLLDLSEVIPATTTEIAGVAEAAGQLGIATTDVVDFTTVMLNLGVATNMTAEDAATSLAKIINITGMTSDKYENLGSSIVALGNNMATTEADIVNMSTRMASAGTQAGMTETDILAIAAAMSSLGMESQAGGSAMARTINKVNSAVISGGDSLTAFADTAGMTADEFKNAWEKDAAGALTYLVAGLSDAGKSGEDLTAILSDMGIQSTNDVNAMMALATSSDSLSNALGISSDAWNQNTALATEAETRYATFESQLVMTKTKMNNVAIEAGGPLLTALSSVIDAAEPLIDMFKGVAERFSGASLETQQMIIKFAAIAIAAGPVITVVGKVTSGIGDMTTNVGKGLQGLATWAGKLVASSAATTAQATATTASTAATQLNTVANAQNTSGLLARTVKVIASSVATKAGAASDAAWNFLVAAGNGTLTAQVAALNASIISKTKNTVATVAHTVAEKARNLITGVGIVATTGYTAATAVQTVAMTICTGAVGLLSAAFKVLTGPIGWITAGVAALSVGVIALVKWFNKETEASKELRAESKELATATDELTGSAEESQKAYENSEASIKAESGAAKSLVQTIRELSAIENKSAEQKQELATYVDMLNGSVDGLNLQYDEQTDALNMTTDAMYAQIDAFEVQAQKQVEQERLTEILKERIVVNEQLVRVQEKITEAENNTNLKDKERKEVIADLTEQQTALTGEMDNLASSHEYVTEKIRETSEAEAAAAEVAAESSNVQIEAYNATIEAAEAMIDTQNTVVNDMKTAYDNIIEAATNMYDVISTESELSINEMLVNQEENTRITAEWANNLAILTERGINEGYIEKLRAAGPDSAAEVALWANATEGEIERLNTNFETGGETAGEAFKTSLGNAEIPDAIMDLVTKSSETFAQQIEAADFAGLAKNIDDGIVKGISDGSGIVLSTIEKLASDTSEEFAEGMGINSPSKVFTEFGEYLIAGLVQGITSKQGELSTAFDSVASKAMESIMKSITSALPQIEKSFTTGFSGASTSVSEQLTKMTTSISNSLTTISSTVTSKVNSIKTTVSTGFTTMASNTTTKMTTMKTAVSTGFTGVNTNVTSGMNTFKASITSGFNTIQATSSSGINAFRETIASGLNTAAAVTNAGASRIVAAMNIYSDMYSSGVYAMQGLENGLNSGSGSVYARANNIAHNVANTVKKALDINSPSRLLMSLGEYAMEGFGIGLENMWPYLKSVTENASNIVSSGLDMELDAPLLTDNAIALQSMSNVVRALDTEKETEKDSGKIEKLLESVIQLLTELKNPQQEQIVVLDDGTLVGRLVDKVDYQLGKKYDRRERG